MRLRQSGLTLLEVLIAVVIVGILARLAMPSYQDYVRRGNIPDGLAALSDLRIKMESYYQDYRNYGVAKCADSSTAGWAKFQAPASSKFAYKCTLSDAGQGYTLEVAGNADTPVSGHTYTLDAANTRKTTAFKGGGVNKSCWLLKGDEC